MSAPSFFDKLKQLVKIKSDVHVTNTGNTKIAGKTKNGNVTIVNIDVNLADPEKRQEAIQATRELLMPAFENNEIMFLQDADRKLVSETRAFEKDPAVSHIIDFYRDKVPASDLNLIRTGLYIESQIEVGKPTKVLTQRVSSSWGRRGKNIVNLASAGYFGAQIMDFYNELEAAGAADFFAEEYNKIVSEVPFAIFVNSSDTPVSIREQIEYKLRRHIRYHVNDAGVALHGWGPNVSTIEQALNDPPESWRVTDSNKYYKGELQIIVARVKPS